MADDVTRCPKCGHENPAAAADCENCGVTFEIYRLEKERAKVLKAKSQDAGPAEEDAADDLAACPNCGQPTDLSSEDCLSCGIVFAKYYDIQERKLADEPEKLEALRTQKQEHEKAVALRQQREKEEKEERQRQEKIEREKLAAKKRQKAEQERLASEQQERVEKKRQDALNDQKADFEKIQAEKLQAAEKETQAVLEKQKAALQKELAAAEQKAANDKEAALKQQQAAFAEQQAAAEKTAEAEKKEALEKQKAALEAEAASRRQAAEAALKAALDRQKADIQANQNSGQLQDMMKALPAQADIRSRILGYEGQTIGVNHSEAAAPAAVILAAVGDDHFSVLVPESDLWVSWPFASVVSVIQAPTGTPVTGPDGQVSVFLVVKVRHP